MQVIVTHQASGRWTVENERHHLELHGGQPREALSPMEAVLGALASCSAIDVVEILHKKRKNFQNLRVLAEGTRRDQPLPRVFTAIHLTFSLQADGLSHAELDKVVALSLDKYCSVAGMLRPNCTITHSCEVSGLTP
jgi:putative redox protein